MMVLLIIICNYYEIYRTNKTGFRMKKMDLCLTSRVESITEVCMYKETKGEMRLTSFKSYQSRLNQKSLARELSYQPQGPFDNMNVRIFFLNIYIPYCPNNTYVS